MGRQGQAAELQPQHRAPVTVSTGRRGLARL